MEPKLEKKYRQRARELVAKLTLDEKLQLITTHNGEVKRLSLAEFYIGTEVARGYVGRKPEDISTVFPQPVGLAGTFDTELMGKLGAIAAEEARAYYNRDKRSALMLWGPTVDLVRDPRWGRTEEAYGEDPCLAGEMSRAYTKTMAGDNGKHYKTIPTLKHFCANNNEENRVDCNAFLPLNLKYEYYYAPFEDAIRHGGAKSLMTAYNEINGIPGLVNPELKTMLKDKWDMWFAVSDGGDFSQNVTGHEFTRTHSQSFALAVKAGNNAMNDEETLVIKAAKKALDEGLLTESELDESIEQTLFARFALGQFDTDCEFDSINDSAIDTQSSRETNLRAAKEQIVLLKNDGLLPLKAPARTIAVLGCMADESHMDWYTGYSAENATVKQGIEREFPESRIIYDNLWDYVSVKAANGKYLSAKESGEVVADSEAVTDAELFELRDFGNNWQCLFSVKYGRYVRFTDGTLRLHNSRIYDWFTRETFNLKRCGERYVAEEFLTHGRLICGEKGEFSTKRINAVRENQLLDIKVKSSGRERGKAIAQKAELVVYCTGNHPLQTAKECYDRNTLELNIQAGMAAYLAGINKNTVMVLVSSYPYSICEENDRLPAIIYTSHAGMYLGTAVAKTLTGEYNPAGRTALTWYKSDCDLADIFDYDIETSGMTYLYYSGTPLYPFGYGLSYSTFEYSDLTVEQSADGAFKARLTVSNTSDTDGEEVVQLYYTTQSSEASRPLKKLCGFKRVFIKAGTSVDVELDINADFLRVYNPRCNRMIIEDCNCTFTAGASSNDARISVQLNISGEKLGLRGARFDAQCFEQHGNVEICYSKQLERQYIHVLGWSGFAVYAGIDFSGKKSISINVSSAMKAGKLTLKFSGENEITLPVAATDGFDSFERYEVELPQGVGGVGSVIVSATENMGILDISVE